MASPVDIGQNIPDTLPADFGEWDSSDSSSAAPAETPTIDPRESSPKETPQRESARREAEALDGARKPGISREVSREFEPASNVTPFPEPDLSAMAPRGFPAPAVRAPRTSPVPAPIATPSVKDDSTFLRRMKSIDTVVDTLPAVESRVAPINASTVPLLERKPDKPLFSSLAVEETVDTEDGPRLLNDLIVDEEERKTKRKWIMSGCVFGGALLLVAFQLFHYGTAGKIKHIVATSPAATAAAAGDSDPEAIVDIKTAATKPSPMKQTSNEEQQPAESTPAEHAETAPAAVQRQMMQFQLAAPTRLPQNAKSVEGDDAPPPSSLGGASIAALNGNNPTSNVFATRSGSNVSGPRVITVSAGVAVGMLTHKTQPLYPAIAKSARVQGTVVLQAKISTSGKVTNLQVISGPPMLRQPAVDAVKTWQYKPYTLNNQPTEVDTTVNVVFSLGG
jgi:periplasmic protein TonB